MVTKNQSNERDQLEKLTIDQLVPADHLVRKLESAIDFSFIYPLVENLCRDSELFIRKSNVTCPSLYSSKN